MELAIVAAIAAAGYYLTGDEKAPGQARRAPSGAFAQPNDTDPYTSSAVPRAQATAQRLADDRYRRAQQPWQTGVVPPFWNSIPGSSTPPLEVRQAAAAPFGGADELAGGPTGGWGAGGVESFGANAHNNMVPFFGGRVRQNTSIGQNQELLETFTGQNAILPRKREVKNMHVNPREAVSGFFEGKRDLSRYMPSIQGGQEGVKPFQPIRVGRGLNEGPTSVPTGGFHDLYQPAEATVDDLRVRSKPKSTYEGRVLPPKSRNDTRSALPGVAQNRPERTVAWTQDNWFGGAAAVAGQSAQPVYEVLPTSRTTSVAYVAPAGPGQSAKEEARPTVLPSLRTPLASDGPRNAGRADGWTVESMRSSDISDYGKQSFATYSNERSSTECQVVHANVRGSVARETAAADDVARGTKKERFVTSQRKGNVRMKGAKQHPVSNLDGLRTTLKETTIHDVRTGNVGRGAPSKTTVMDPDDWKMRTTAREVFGGDSDFLKQPVLTGRRRATLHLEDAVRATVKQTTIDDGRVGGAARRVSKPTTYDPDDVARRTIKETTVGDTREGSINASLLQSGRGYLAEGDAMVAKATHRQVTSDEEYFPDGARDRGQGYATASWEAGTTLRELVADSERVGGAGTTGAKAPMSHDDVDAATTNAARETTLVGRAPTQQGAKVALGGDGVVQGCQRTGVEADVRAPSRASTFGVGPSAGACDATKDSIRLSGDVPDTRLDPDLLTPLRENPYSIVLSP